MNGLPSSTGDHQSPAPARCGDCDRPLAPSDDIVPAPGQAGRFSHRPCRMVVLDIAFRAVGL